MSTSPRAFPGGFTWGVATSGYQIFAVEATSRRRIPKASAGSYASIVRANALPSG